MLSKLLSKTLQSKVLTNSANKYFSKVGRGEHVIGIDLGTTNSCVAMVEGS